MDDVVNLIRAVVASARALPDVVAAGLRRWVLDQHRPEEINGEAWCLRDKALWPCDTVVRLTDSDTPGTGG